VNVVPVLVFFMGGLAVAEPGTMLTALATPATDPGIPVWVAVAIVLACVALAALVIAAIRWRVGLIRKSTNVQPGTKKAPRPK